MFISAIYIKAQEIQKFDINDPRNPDCPCHKYQKIAEMEYQKLLAKAEKKKPDKEIEMNENGTSMGEMNGKEEGISSAENGVSKNEKSIPGKENRNSSGNLSSGGTISQNNLSGGISQKKNNSQKRNRHKKKKHIKKHPLWNRIKGWQGWDICRDAKVVSACFHWK
jgi:hypothetical protein